jgi:hypothetical protein
MVINVDTSFLFSFTVTIRKLRKRCQEVPKTPVPIQITCLNH